MMELDKATPDDFIQALNQDFELITGTGTISLRLVAVDKKGPSHPARPDPFTLQFEGAPPLRIPQAIHRLQNVTVGQFDLFLVQVGAGREGEPLRGSLQLTLAAGMRIAAKKLNHSGLQVNRSRATPSENRRLCPPSP